MEITITKENAEFILKTKTSVEGGKRFNDNTYFLPVFYKMTDVMIDINVVTGRFGGQWIEYSPTFTDEAQELLNIVQ
jgi:hypothetical protein